ncbi:MAG TPA: SDR family NAD(P)-dependent oxidoreductase [Burkholderiales bacterium]|nr:SDR family NAD(P)-dependent oxidoreductase [Burkholderiales bacterium]
MDTGLKNKSVLITGASRNMGRFAALAFAREGANLALCTSRKMKELGAVAEEARALGASVVAEQCDVTDGAAVAAFVKHAREKLGGVDIAVNVAGFRNEAKFLEGSLEEWTRNIDVNLNGPFNICRSVIPLMIERRWGRIINLSGVAPYLGGGAAKAMVKLGIVGFTRGLAREFAEFNITANCIGPGTIGRGEREAHESEKELRPWQPIRRTGRPEEVTALMLHLASENAGYITGQCYLINGGAYFS